MESGYVVIPQGRNINVRWYGSREKVPEIFSMFKGENLMTLGAPLLTEYMEANRCQKCNAVFILMDTGSRKNMTGIGAP